MKQRRKNKENIRKMRESIDLQVTVTMLVILTILLYISLGFTIEAIQKGMAEEITKQRNHTEESTR